MTRKPLAALAGGAVIGVLGGLIGLGGAEFRLPLLIGVFGFARYSQDRSFAVLGRHRGFVLLMAAGPWQVRWRAVAWWAWCPTSCSCRSWR